MRLKTQIEGMLEQEKAVAMRVRGDAVADQGEGGAVSTLSVGRSVVRDNGVGVGD